MRCFNHGSDEAVGVCKACGKGLCRTCAVDLGEGLACADACEVAVRNMIVAMRMSQQSLRAMPQSYRNQSAVGFLSGAVFAAVGVLTLLSPLWPIAPLFGVLATPMILQAVRARRMARRLDGPTAHERPLLER